MMPTVKCICCLREGDQADLEPTYDWLHPHCIERWHRRRELNAPLYAFLSSIDGDKAMKLAAVAFVVMAFVQCAIGMRGSAEAEVLCPPVAIDPHGQGCVRLSRVPQHIWNAP